MSAGIAALVAQLAELTAVLRPVAERIAAETSPAGRDPKASPEVPAVATTGQPGDQPTDERAEQIAGLRELADYLEAHPGLPLGPYDVEMQIHVRNLPYMRDKDEPAKLAELARIAEVLGVDADLRDEPGSMHPHVTKTFRGGARYQAVYVTEAYKRGYKPAPTDIPRGDEEVAGPAEGTGPATASPEQAEWSPGAGLARVRRELPGIVPELTDDDMRQADDIIAAGRPAGSEG